MFVTLTPLYAMMEAHSQQEKYRAVNMIYRYERYKVWLYADHRQASTSACVERQTGF